METMEEIIKYANRKKLQCRAKWKAYGNWLTLLTPFNLIFIGLGGSLSFLGGAEVLTNGDTIFSNTSAGLFAMIGGLLTGLHKWLDCDKHQAECHRLRAGFAFLESKYSRVSETGNIMDANISIRDIGNRYDDLIDSAKAFPPAFFEKEDFDTISN